MAKAINFAQLRILVVDDQAFIRNLLRVMLRNLGVNHIDYAADGETAQRILAERGNSVHCVIADWNMEPGDGLQLLRKVRTGELPDIRSNLPFIMLSGHSTSPVVTAALNLDVDAFIVKPVSGEKLAAALNKALAGTKTSKPASFYRKVAGVQLPDNLKAQTDDPSQWAKWVKSGRQEVYDGEASHIRRDKVELKDPPPEDDTPELRNIRQRRVDRIKAGQVLVEKLCDAEGVELLKAGTVLSEKMLKRLVTMVDEKGQPMRLVVGEFKEP